MLDQIAFATGLSFIARRKRSLLALCVAVLLGLGPVAVLSAFVGVPTDGSTTPNATEGSQSLCCCTGDTLAWVELDYLMWWTRGMSLPPLVTASPANVPQAEAGVLEDSRTTVLFGDEQVNDRLRSGLRLDAGLWLDCAGCCGLEFDFFALESLSAPFHAASAGDPILARPFGDVVTGEPSSELISYPGLVRGDVRVSAASPGLWSWGLARRQCLCCYDAPCGRGSCRTDWLIGYRHVRLDDRVVVQERLTSPLFLAGTELGIEDRFATRNSFHGLELGLVRTAQHRDWQLECFGKVALGWNDARTRIRGESVVTTPGRPTLIHAGGLLALDSNMGQHDDVDFASVFQFGSELAYRLTDRLSLTVGYSLLIWPDVFRAGDQIDTTINPNLLPPPREPLVGAPRPAARLHDTDFWAQGLNLGVEYRY